MIVIKKLEAENWIVTVEGQSKTEHRVRLSAEDLARLGNGRPAEDLLRKSFEFLLEREPNTAILRSFDLPIIGRYFPDYEAEIRCKLK